MRRNLNQNWVVQSSSNVTLTGENLSKPTADTTNWYKTNIPATVLGTLVENGVYADPFYSDNFLKLPARGPKSENFSLHPMPADSPFAVSWWFRKTFDVPATAAEFLSLKLDGVNYRGNIWLNGTLLADSVQIMGTYREFELDVSSVVKRGGENVLAIELFAPLPCDPAVTWVDWNPSPPDKSTGIWKDVWLCESGPIQLRYSHVTTQFVGDSDTPLSKARLTVGGDLINLSQSPQSVTVEITLDGTQHSCPVSLAPGEKKRFEHPVVLDNPRVWWPRELGSPELYTIGIQAKVDGNCSDKEQFSFGVREMTSELTENKHALFKVNGVPLLIRGAGWAPDMYLRRFPEREFTQLEYVKDLNLNTVRFEGMMERAEYYDWCDREGILIIAGWCCCDIWEEWDKWTDETHYVTAESLRSQLSRLRRHPSMLTWWYGSDFAPPEPVEKKYLEVIAETHWPNCRQSSAANKPTKLTGESGMKMAGPYEYVPPSYWLEDKNRGGGFGFATEICPGPAMVPIESLKKMMPADKLWPVNDVWNVHTGGHIFDNINVFAGAIEKRYGESSDVETFITLAEATTFETQKAMFEAYTKNRFTATGVIQWMLNNSWPSLIWHLYDYYLRPAAGYYAVKNACEPLHVMYNYVDGQVTVTSTIDESLTNLSVVAKVFDAASNELSSQTAPVAIEPRGTTDVFKLAGAPEGVSLRFVDLRLKNGDNVLSHNFYWVPTQLDKLDYKEGNWAFTPITEHADLTALRTIDKVTLEMESVPFETEGVYKIRLKNTSDKIAVFVDLCLLDDTGTDIVPIKWSNNYVSLLPGDIKLLTATVMSDLVEGKQLTISAKGLNVPKTTLKL